MIKACREDTFRSVYHLICCFVLCYQDYAETTECIWYLNMVDSAISCFFFYLHLNLVLVISQGATSCFHSTGMMRFHTCKPSTWTSPLKFLHLALSWCETQQNPLQINNAKLWRWHFYINRRSAAMSSCWERSEPWGNNLLEAQSQLREHCTCSANVPDSLAKWKRRELCVA